MRDKIDTIELFKDIVKGIYEVAYFNGMNYCEQSGSYPNFDEFKDSIAFFEFIQYNYSKIENEIKLEMCDWFCEFISKKKEIETNKIFRNELYLRALNIIQDDNTDGTTVRTTDGADAENKDRRKGEHKTAEPHRQNRIGSGQGEKKTTIKR